MAKLRFLFATFVFLSMCGTAASAQQRRVTGQVTETGGAPLPAATVQIIGTTLGALTNEEGRFTINASDGTLQLRVRRIGFKARIVPVPAGQNEVNVALERDVLQLETQVVTGAATSVARVNAANDVTVLNTDQLNRTPTPTVENALQGRIAGAQVNTNSGAPGGGAQIRLRGVTSFFGASDPLYVVDGVLLSNDVVSSGLNAVSASSGGLTQSSQDNSVNRIADLNPADIETMEVLKGSSASAIYGAKGANGVIVITTKKGRAGRTDFNVTQRVGTFEASNKLGARRFSLAEAYEYGTENIGLDSATIKSNFDSCNGFCDFEEDVFGKRGLAYETNLSARGGSENTRFFASGLAKYDPGIAANTGYRKQTLRLNVNQNVGSRLTLSVNTNLTHSLTERGLSNNDNVNATPYFVFGQVPSFLNFRPVDGQFPALGVGSNPIQTAQLLRTPEEIFRLIGAVNANYSLLAQERQTLALSLTAGIDQFSQQDRIFAPRELQFEPNDDLPGTNTSLNATNINANYSLSLTHAFNPASQLFTATTSAGMQRELKGQRTTNVVGQNCTSGLRNVDACTVRNAFANRTEIRDLAFYGQEELLLLDERLLLTAAARGQRSTVNGDEEKFYLFPKASASYRLPTFVDQVSELKMRVAAGRAGNQPLYNFKFSPYSSGVYDGNPSIISGLVRGDSAIKPEISTEFEGGFDLTAFNSRASLAFTVYQKTVTDLILRPSAAPSRALAQEFLNGGTLRNRGTEVSLALTPISSNRVTFVSRTTFARNVGRVMDLPAFVPIGGFTIPGSFGYGNYTIREGFPPTLIVGRDTAGAPLDPIYGVNNLIYGNTAPDFNMGFSNDLQFGGFRVTSLFDWQQGGDNINITQDVYDAFELSPDVADAARRQAFQNKGSTALQIQDASFVKLREVTVGYDIPAAYTSRLFGSYARGVRAELAGRNLYTWTSYRGLDPEVSNFGNQSIIRGADLAPFPPSRSYFFSLSVDF